MDTPILKTNHTDYRFKIIYAVAMIMVIGGHCGGGGITLDFSGWFSYYELHLALFMFSSGYFYKGVEKDNILKYIFKKTKSLIVPLYIYNFLYGVLVQILRLKGFQMGGNFSIDNLIIMPITNGHQFVYNLGGWFVAPLFMIEVYNVLIRKFLSKLRIPEWIYFAINVLLGLIGNYIAYKGVNQGIFLVIVRMLHFLPYFSFGTFYNRFLEKYSPKISSMILFLCIFGFKFLIFLTGQKQSYTPSWCNDFSKYPFLPIIIAYAGILFWLRIARILEPVIGKNKCINLVADNTYSIMINHLSFFMIIKTIFALICKYTTYCHQFDMQRYKSDIWYFYLPNGIFQIGIIYLIAGILGPIVMNLTIRKLKYSIFKRKE